MAKLKIQSLLFCIITAMALGFCLNSFAAEDKILCVVGDDLITQKDLNEYLALASFELSARFPDKKEFTKKLEAIKKDALQQIIDERMILQEAKRQKIKVDEDFIQERLDYISSQYPSKQDFENALVLEGLTLNDVKRKIGLQLTVEQAVDQNVRSKIFVHPKEVTDYYKEHASEFNSPETAKVDSIFIAGDASSQKIQERAQEAMKLLKSGEELLSVAQKYSDGPSLGIVRRGQLRKEIEDAIFKLKINENSGPIKTEQGFFIFKLLEIMPSQEMPFSSVKSEVYAVVFQNKFKARFDEWLNTIKKDVYCVIK